MHNPTIKLHLHDIFTAPAISGDDNGIGIRISKSLISDAIEKVHSSAVNMIFDGSGHTLPRMPEIDLIATNKTKFWQFGAIFEDEGTIAGTYGVHQSIFLDQLRLFAADKPTDLDDFASRLWLVHGDSLTAHHNRVVKAEQVRAGRPYDRRDWLLGLPAWFHIQMNLLNTIVRTHFGPTQIGQEAHHCIEADITTWGRSSMNRKNIKYHLLEPIVAQGFTARVLALFYTAMRRRGYLKDVGDLSFERPDEMDKIINNLSPTAYLQLVDDVRLSAFTLTAWKGVDPENKQPIADIEFRTMCRMLQEVELFLTMRHAIKHGDIGLLRYLVDPLIIHFLGTSQYNYGYEMLFYRWNLSPVNTPELQRAILASGLVNWQGKSTTNKPIDLGLEHLNGNCKIEMKCYKNSTHDISIIFDRVCLSNTWVRALREKLEDSFGESMPGTHTTAPTLLEIFFLARNLFLGDLAEPRSAERLAGHSRVFDSDDILQIGMDKLAEKVEYFNSHYVYRPGIGTRVGHDNLSSAPDADINTAEYANIIDERFDGITDPTADPQSASLEVCLKFYFSI